MPAKSNAKPDLSVLPGVDELLRTDTGRKLAAAAGPEHAADLARKCIAEAREQLLSLKNASTKAEALAAVENELLVCWSRETRRGTRRVINATGVVIHTNLGRSPLSADAQKAIRDAAGFAAVEYDLTTGKRGKRGERTEQLITELTGAEAALIVNNCAAAAFFVLTVFASGGEVIVSRGELVEIGGDFRVPDVLEQSGADLREVGTTNRTKIADYERAVKRSTKMLLRVHPSNYRIIGFTDSPSTSDLAALARKKKLLFYEDLGSGAMIDLSAIGLDEPVARRAIKDGAQIVTFSGDKLLGGPQAGIIAGKRKLIDQLRKHPLYRALRVSKLTYAALNATLEAYRRGNALNDVPVLRMLSLGTGDIGKRAKAMAKKLVVINGLRAELLDGVSAVGGGAAPGVERPTVLIALTHETRSASELAGMFRNSTPPVITRVEKGKVLIDLRTVDREEERDLVQAITKSLA